MQVRCSGLGGLRTFPWAVLVAAATVGLPRCADAGETVTEADRNFWSFRKPSRPPLPQVRDVSAVRTPVDAFVLAKLEPKGRSLAPEADRRVLVRRASLDLVGLPPTPEEVEAFLADKGADAFERLVDRLLASPGFGLRWGRHWLDLVGYTDTVGFDVDADLIIMSEGKWRYRDYVIRAFNDDKPYDRFLTEQLAGDELVEWRNARTYTRETLDLLVATGYLRTAMDFTHEEVGVIPQNFYGVLHDTIEIVGSSLLGLTLNCARCHSHKFDPIPQEDYYRFMALFTPAYNPSDWKVVYPFEKKLKPLDRALPAVSASERAEIERFNADLDRRAREWEEKAEAIRGPYRRRLLDQKLEALPPPIRGDARAALATPAGKRNEGQRDIAGKFEAALAVSPEAVTAALSAGDRAAVESASQQAAALRRRKRSFARIQALYDVGPPPPTRLLIRGNHETPGREVRPGFLGVLNDDDAPDWVPATPVASGTSGRRLALARWLTADGSRPAGLVSRVMVNRVWQHLFGRGIVPTPENFGLGGEPPSHPELLEWLGAEFIRGGWRLKPFVRQIVTSAAYRQASEPVGGADDPENRLFGRMPLKRLEAEAIRDAILAVSGRLDPTMGGPPVLTEAKPDGTVVIDRAKLPDPAAAGRRSVYLLARHAFHPTLMTVFDQPVLATNCPERNRSAVPLQSLTLMNDAFLFEQADAFADRVARHSGPSAADRTDAAFRLALGRAPGASERVWSGEFLVHQSRLYLGADAPRKALADLCHALLGTSEFLYCP
jgi:Protein of unknown function (DUF1553)/Protein of unknown function (DUF1549)